MSYVTSIAAERLREELINEPIPVLVEFYAPQCPGCKLFAPFFEELAEKHAGRARALRVNVDEAPELAQEQHIRLVPTVVFFWEGQEVDRVEGLMSPYKLMVKMTQIEELAHLEPATAASGYDGI